MDLIIQICKHFQCLTPANMCIIKHLIQFFTGLSVSCMYSGLGIKISIADNRHLLCQEKAMELGLQFHWSTDRTWLTGTTWYSAWEIKLEKGWAEETVLLSSPPELEGIPHLDWFDWWLSNRNFCSDFLQFIDFCGFFYSWETNPKVNLGSWTQNHHLQLFWSPSLVVL